MVFKPGESGNIAGKPRETRNKLSATFLRALHTSFQEKGVEAIDRVIRDDPAGYLRVIASVIPKEFEITSIDKDLSDEQLADLIAALRSGIGAGIIRAATSEKGVAEQTKDVSSLH